MYAITYSDHEAKQQRKEHQVKWDERHWTEKSLEEMTDRDWRILREDFNVSTKGGRIPAPIRYWNEAPFSKEICSVIESLGYKVMKFGGGYQLCMMGDFFALCQRTPHPSSARRFP